MSRVYLPAVALLLFVIEGTVFQQFVSGSVNYIFVPRFLLAVIILIGIHIGRYNGIAYGIVFGLLYDIVYSPLLGVYMFGFGFIGYAFAFYHKRVQQSLLIQLAVVVVAIVLFDTYQFGIYRLIELTDHTIEAFLYNRIIPTVLLNGAFTILIYFPIKRLFDYVLKQQRLRER